MRLEKLDSDFLQYLIDNDVQPEEKLPTLSDISDELNISVGKLREQLEQARALGLVSVKPRVGSRREAYRFDPAVLPSMLFALATEEATFAQVSQLRRGLEEQFWQEAVSKLLAEDVRNLQAIVAAAWAKLNGERIQIPFQEHRDLHLTIFGRIDNPFISGLLIAYWDAYDASELTRYQSLEYWQQVWTYHEHIVAAIAEQRFEEGRRILIDHFNLLTTIPTSPQANGR
jgi:DNA-binding FadR family transcriptional regulator